jgi:uncharacterized protein
MNFSEVILFVVLGAVVGFAGGLFAIGGALIAIPLLTAGFSFTQHDSQGTAMVMALASACVTLAIYVRKGLLRVRDSLLMIACSTALGLASSQLVRYVNDGILQRSFGVFDRAGDSSLVRAPRISTLSESYPVPAYCKYLSKCPDSLGCA